MSIKASSITECKKIMTKQFPQANNRTGDKKNQLEEGPSSHLKIVRPRSYALSLKWAMLPAYMKLKMYTGHIVILIGDTGTGKTELLKRLTPGRVIDHSKERLKSLEALPLPRIEDNELPTGFFSIDELGHHNRDCIERILISRSRVCTLSIQRAEDIRRIGLDKMLEKRRVAIVEIIPRS